MKNKIKLSTFKIKDINPARYNPRKISTDELTALTESVKKFGLVDPLIVNVRDGANTLVGGHQRLKVAEKLGYEEVPVSEVDLSLAEEKALNVALNSSTLQGKFDLEILPELLKEIKLDLPKLSLDLRFDILESEFTLPQPVEIDYGQLGIAAEVNKGNENSEWMSDTENTAFEPSQGYITLIYHFQSEQSREEFVMQNNIKVDTKKSKQWIVYR